MTARAAAQPVAPVAERPPEAVFEAARALARMMAAQARRRSADVGSTLKAECDHG